MAVSALEEKPVRTFMHCCRYIAETLPWRRVADLHVMISSAVIGMLGWTLYREQITQIFQQEEGRYMFILTVSCFCP